MAIALNHRDSMAGAAKRARIGKSTLYRWLRLAEKGDPRFAVLLPVEKGGRRSWLEW